MKRIVLLCLTGILLSACGLLSGEPGATATPAYTPTPDPCSPNEIVQYLDAIRDVARRFDDAVELANVTPRASLQPAIADLQAIRRDTEDLGSVDIW